MRELAVDSVHIDTSEGAGICLRDLTTTSAFSFLVSSSVAAVYYFSRLEFEDSHFSEIITCLSLSGFLTCSGSMWRLLCETTALRSKIHDSAIYILALLFICVLGMLETVVSFNSTPLFEVIGTISVTTTLLVWIKGVDRWAGLLLTALGATFGTWVGIVALGSGYQDPLFSETLLIGDPSLDTLFHVSVANIFKTYGIPSTGLDGIPYLAYHFGSHWLFGQLATVLKMDIIQFYNLGFPIIFIPFLLNSIMVFALTYRVIFLRMVTSDAGLKPSWGFWGVLILAHLGVVPAKIHGGNSQLISESYAVGLTAFFLFSSITVHLWQIGTMDTPRGSKRTIASLFLMIPLMLAVVGFLKSSLMVLSFILVSYLVIRSDFLSLRQCLLFLAINAIVLILVINLTISKNTPGLSFEPFHYLKNFVQQEWWPWFPFFELLWSWLFIFLRTRELGITTVGSIKDAIVSKKALDLEVVAVVSLTGLIPGLLMAIPGGSAAYFSDFQRWLSVSLIMANLYQFRSVLWKTKTIRANS